jgi:predicted ATPase/class 3 adenylate cyclase
VTVLFADLVGFTSRAESMDPEDVEAILAPYHQRLRRELERHGGTVEKFIGDAVMAVFGAPIAHEDDPERAVRAALAIRDAIREADDLEVRIAVNTGEALVSLGARASEGEAMAAGDVVNTGARLQSSAPVNGILVGEATYRATREAIEYRDAEPVRAKGKAEPIPVWEAIEARSRFGVDVAQRARTPLVGRRRELDVLLDALARTRSERSPQLVTLVGVPGIGKSRLVLELFQAVDADPDLIFWRQGRSLPYGEAVSFWALGEMVKAHAGILETDADEQAKSKLHRVVTDALVTAEEGRWVEEHLRPLVGLARQGEPGGDRRDEAFAAWRRFFEALADERPLVLVFEDLQWADDGLLDFIDHLVDWASDVPLFVVCSARPELLARRSEWGGGKPNATTLSLSPLSDDETARLLAAVLKRSVLPAEVQSALLARAGGNPLYAEEFARLVQERDRLGDLDSLPVPETVQGIIAARLDGLAEGDKQLLQDAAVVGKIFWLGALAAVGDSERRSAEERLHGLERRQLVRRERRSSVAGETEYAFSHVLVRDAAYAQIPRGQRADKHRRAAAWIESLGEERAADRSEMLAHHYVSALQLARAAGQTTAELEAPARLALRAAGDRSVALNAFEPAIRLYRQALALWPEDDAERPQLLLRYARAFFRVREGGEEQLQEALAALSAAGDVAAAAEMEMGLGELDWRAGQRDLAFEHFDRAAALVAELERSPSKADVIAGLSRFHMLADQNDQAIRLGREALAMAEQLGMDETRAAVLNNIGTARVNAGDLGGLEDLERSRELAEEVNVPEAARAYINLASVTNLLGDIRRGRQFHERGLEVAQRFGIAGGIRWLAAEMIFDRYWAGEWDEALESADAFIAEVEAGSPHYMESAARIARAEMRLARGDVSGALSDSARNLEHSRLAKDPQLLFPALAHRGRILAAAGRQSEGDAVATELLELVSSGGGHLASNWIYDLARILTESGRGPDVLRLLQEFPAGYRWAEAARFYVQDDLVAAADILAEMGALPEEAAARLRAAERLFERGRRSDAEAQLARALAFYRSVGATAYVSEGEALLVASA